MFFSIPVYVPNNYNRTNGSPKSYKTLQEALVLVKDAIKGEKENELFYSYLMSVTPTEEEKSIIASIINDEIKHNNYFNEIYHILENSLTIIQGLPSLKMKQKLIGPLNRLIYSMN